MVEEDEEFAKYSLITQLYEIMKYRKSPFLVIAGVIGAIANGASLPTYAIYLGKIMVVLAVPNAPDFHD